MCGWIPRDILGDYTESSIKLDKEVTSHKCKETRLDPEKINNRKWSAEELSLFQEVVDLFGINSYEQISIHMGTQGYTQVAWYKHKMHPETKKTKHIDPNWKIGKWTDEECRLYKEGVEQFGEKSHKNIANHMGTRSKDQVWVKYHEVMEN